MPEQPADRPDDTPEPQGPEPQGPATQSPAPVNPEPAPPAAAEAGTKAERKANKKASKPATKEAKGKAKAAAAPAPESQAETTAETTATTPIMAAAPAKRPARKRGRRRGPPPAQQRPRPTSAAKRPRLLAAALVLPYLMLSLTWAFSNPPGAAPDEQHHLVKAIGSGSFQIGRAGPPVEAGAPANVETRNASITRIYQIPERLLSGEVYRCFAFKIDVTADCLPDQPPGSGDAKIDYDTPIGAYPPFLYTPLGWAALSADNPEDAFVSGRIVVAVLSALLLFLGVTHAVRWLGRGSMLAFVPALTPMAIYATGILSVSGIEIAASVAVAAVVMVALRRPESVHERGTHLTLLVAGVALVLGRQLGVVALGLMLIVLLIAAGRTHIVQLLRERRPTFLLTTAAIGLATILVVWWELTYDKPSNTGTALNKDALLLFVENSYNYLVSSIGLFGWLDTRLPGPAIGAWLTLWVVVVTSALVLGRRRDVAIVAIGLASIWVLAFAIYASVFYTVSANIQGRQFLGFTAFLVILAGGVVVERLPSLGKAAVARVHLGVGLVAAGVQVFALYYNARRYAVGIPGPVWFVPEAQWVPPLGYELWMGVAGGAGLLLVAVVFFSRPRALVVGPTSPDASPTEAPADERVVHHVER